MSITRGNWDLHSTGSKDAARHKEKLQDAFKKQLKDIISNEDIIASGPKGKTVKVPIKSLDTWRFIFDSRKSKHVGQGGKDFQPGDVLEREPKKGEAGQPDKAGGEPGVEYYEAEIALEELIEMMLEDLHLPRLDPKKAKEMRANDIQYDDIRKKGAFSNIDKKRTLIENIKRNAAKGEARVGDFRDDDLRFRSWNQKYRPITSAAVVAMMDVSGSMTDDKKYLARSFFFWMVNFLRHKYEEVKIVFISHPTEAKECTEHEFFYQGQSGGTRCSSAYETALQIIDERFDPNLYNIFAFHFSDGDTWNDTDECVALLKQLAKVCNMVGYGEIGVQYDNAFEWGYSTLATEYAAELGNVPNFVQGRIVNKEDVWPILKLFFSEELE